jgi:ADP-heptose:LPS heptosyltransferase
MGISKHHLKFYGRVVRANGLWLWLRLTLLVCKIEDWLRPVAVKREKRVLVIVFGGLGDCLLFDPMFRRMKEQWPGARVDVLTGSFEAMWEGLDSIDERIYFRRSRFRLPTAYFSFFRRLYRNRYDIAVEGIAMMPKRGVWGIMSALMLQATCAPLRVGRPTTGRLVFAPHYRHDCGFSGAADRKERQRAARDPFEVPHSSIHRYIELPPPQQRSFHEAGYVARAIGIDFFRRPDEPRLRPESHADEWAANVFRSSGLDGDGPVVGLVVETTYRLKRWSIERFIEIVEHGLRDGLRFVLLGQAEQVPELENRFPPDRFLNLSGQTTLAQMIAAVRACDVFLSADTGPAHVAQACGVPSVILFGPSNDAEFGPADRVKHAVVAPTEVLPCRPCVLGPCVLGHSCMNFLTVDTVYAKLLAKVESLRAGRDRDRVTVRVTGS